MDAQDLTAGLLHLLPGFAFVHERQRALWVVAEDNGNAVEFNGCALILSPSACGQAGSPPPR